MTQSNTPAHIPTVTAAEALEARKVKDLPTPEQISAHLEYRNGALFWRKPPRFRGKKLNGPAGFLSKGYTKIRLCGVTYFAHRLIWVLHNESIPDGMIVDHINQDKSDNRIENLRLLTVRENALNKPKLVTNKSGFTGVHWSRGRQKWRGMVAGRTVHMSADKNEVVLAVMKAREDMGFSPIHGIMHSQFTEAGAAARKALETGG